MASRTAIMPPVQARPNRISATREGRPRGRASTTSISPNLSSHSRKDGAPDNAPAPNADARFTGGRKKKHNRGGLSTCAVFSAG